MSFSLFVSLYGEQVHGEMRPEQGRRGRSHELTRYLISFDHGAMHHIPDEEGRAVGEAAHAGDPGGQGCRRVCVRRRMQ